MALFHNGKRSSRVKTFGSPQVSNGRSSRGGGFESPKSSREIITLDLVHEHDSMIMEFESS